MTGRSLLLTVVVAMTGAACANQRADIHVSPGGNDAAAGTAGAPLATLAAARDAVRKLRAAEPDRAAPVIVELADGRYELTETLQLGPDDSGSAASPTIYRAATGAQPVISGGRVIRGWKKTPEGWWRTTVPGAARRAWMFRQLWVDGRRRYRTRLPETGTQRISGTVPASEKARGRGYDRFAFSGDQIRGDWHHLGDVEVVAFHSWIATPYRIASVNDKIVTLADRTKLERWWLSLQAQRRFLVRNVREALGQTGRWYLDYDSGELTYAPATGESVDDAEVIAPCLDVLLRVAGDISDERWVQHVRFEGLTFAHTMTQLPVGGRSYCQADVQYPAAVGVFGGRAIAFDGCTFQHVGEYALEIGLATRDCRVEDSELLDMGGGGLKLGTLSMKPEIDGRKVDLTDELAASHTLVRNNLIARGGRMLPGAIALCVANSHHNTIVHNEIFDFYYTGVTLGWRWSYGPSFAHHNELAWNRIHKCGQRMLNDMGAVYTLGESHGTTIHHNLIHDIYGYRHGAAGFYTDQASTGIIIENNLVYDTLCGGYRHHFGKNLTVRNNTFVNGELYQIHRELTEKHANFHFTRNIVYYRQGYLLNSDHTWDPEKSRMDMDHNLYWKVGGDVIFPGAEGKAHEVRTLQKWQQQTGREKGSIVADPLFVNAAKHDYRLKKGSPAEKIGFEPFDVSQAGRLNGFRNGKDLPDEPKAW